MVGNNSADSAQFFLLPSRYIHPSCVSCARLRSGGEIILTTYPYFLDVSPMLLQLPSNSSLQSPQLSQTFSQLAHSRDKVKRCRHANILLAHCDNLDRYETKCGLLRFRRGQSIVYKDKNISKQSWKAERQSQT